MTMTIYELCKEWARLAPDECVTDAGDVMIKDRGGESEWLTSIERKGADGWRFLALADAVQVCLERRIRTEKLEIYTVLDASGYACSVEAFERDNYGSYKGVSRVYTQALLTAYVAYLATRK